MPTLTDHSNEVPFSALVTGKNQIEIPYYQRKFRWSNEKIDALQKDLERVLNEGDESDVHFMGAIIVHKPQVPALVPQPIEVIDGQQRLTALFLHLTGLITVLASNEHYVQAANYLEQYVLLSHNLQLSGSNLKIISSGEDRESMNRVMATVTSFPQVMTRLPNHQFVPLPVTVRGRWLRVEQVFKLARSWAEKKYADGQVELIELLINSVLQRLTVVEIMVRDPLSGPVIFDRLNSKTQPLTIGELVKNDVFSRAPVAGQQHQVLETTVWKPFYDRFGDPKDKLFDDYFFPYGLVSDSSTKKADVYSRLQKSWSERSLTPSLIVKELEEFQADYLDVVRDGNSCQHPLDFIERLRRFRGFNAPSSIYPFLMRVSYELRHGRLPLAHAVALLDVLESFLVRRAVCGHEPTGLHAVFKRLWEDLGSPLTDPVAQVSSAIREHATVKWPSEADFRNSLLTRPLYKSRITPFLLREWNAHLGGDRPPVTTATIEHCAPQSISNRQCWISAWSSDDHKRAVDTIGNLTLLSPGMNSGLGNRCWDEKRVAFEEDSMFKSTRDLGRLHAQWTPVDYDQRAANIADWAVATWRH